MNENAVRKLIRERCNTAGSESSFAAQIGVTQQLVNAVLTGARPPRGKILDVLGLEIVISYRAKKPPDEFSELKIPNQTNTVD